MEGFKSLLLCAQHGDEQAKMQIIKLYWGLIMKNSMVDGYLDDDLRQALIVAVLTAIKNFRTL